MNANDRKKHQAQKRQLKSKRRRLSKKLQINPAERNNRRRIMALDNGIMQLIIEIQHKFQEVAGMFQIAEETLANLCRHATGEELTEEQVAQLIDFIPIPEPVEIDPTTATEQEQEQLELPLEGVGNTPTSEEIADFVPETTDEDTTEDTLAGQPVVD